MRILEANEINRACFLRRAELITQKDLIDMQNKNMVNYA